MSDDRYDQNGGSSGRPDDSTPDDEEYGEDAKTQLVDLDALQKGAAESSDPDHAPPPSVGSSENAEDPDVPPKSTELMHSVPGPGDGDDEDAVTSSAPDVDDQSFGGGQPDPSRGTDTDSTGGNFSSLHGNDASMGGEVTSSAGDVSSSAGDVSSSTGDVSSGSGQQVVVGDGGDAGHDEATQFINVEDFADQDEEDAHFTPEQEEAGYDGSTQFVDINALQAGAEADAGDPIDNDQELHRGYQFEAEDIHRGELTLIEAQNALGKDVVLKRIWEGTPDEMSTPLRERIAELNELSHPHLISMNGMFVSDSGMWIEIDSPTGHRLGDVIEQNGPLDAETVLDWVEPIAEVLQFVHDEQLAYANLTPEAVWLEDDGTVKLEPFDMLRIEERGDLGPYGPPEMDAPPEERELSPATDVYSLAAVVGAALTRVPFEPGALEEHDSKLVDTVRAGLASDPTERPQSVDDFVEQLHGGDGLDIKVVGGIVFSVLLLATGGLAVAVNGDDASAQNNGDETVDQQQQEQQQDDQTEDESDTDGEDTDEADDQRQAARVDLPDTVSEDPRLTIETSYELNPPEEAVEVAGDAQLEEWRRQARELRTAGDETSSDSEKRQNYIESMKYWTRVIEATGSEPDPDDRTAWRELYEKDLVREEISAHLDDIQESLLEGNIGSARRRYRKLDAIDPAAEATGFLSRRGTADVVELQRNETGEQSDDE